jgi:WD40 repeat-containing protein SMU1
LQEGVSIKSQVNLPTIHSLELLPGSPGIVVCGNLSNFVYLVDYKKGQVFRSFKSGDNVDKTGRLNTVSVSARGDYIYCTNEQNKFVTFDSRSGKIRQNIDIGPDSKSEVVGSCHHPFSNILAMWVDNGTLTLWK